MMTLAPRRSIATKLAATTPALPLCVARRAHHLSKNGANPSHRALPPTSASHPPARARRSSSPARVRERGLRDRRKNPVGSPTDALGAPSAPTSGQRRQRSAGRARPFSAPRSLLRARVSRSADRPRRRRRGLPRPRFLGFSSSARSALRRRRRAPAPSLPPRTTIPDGRPRSHRRPRTLRPATDRSTFPAYPSFLLASRRGSTSRLAGATRLSTARRPSRRMCT
jgi:hypothetical protein